MSAIVGVRIDHTLWFEDHSDVHEPPRPSVQKIDDAIARIDGIAILPGGSSEKDRVFVGDAYAGDTRLYTLVRRNLKDTGGADIATGSNGVGHFLTAVDAATTPRQICIKTFNTNVDASAMDAERVTINALARKRTDDSTHHVRVVWVDARVMGEPDRRIGIVAMERAVNTVGALCTRAPTSMEHLDVVAEIIAAMIREAKAIEAATGRLMMDVSVDNFVFSFGEDGHVIVQAMDYGGYLPVGAETTQSTWLHPTIFEGDPIVVNDANFLSSCAIAFMLMYARGPHKVKEDIITFSGYNEFYDPGHEIAECLREWRDAEPDAARVVFYMIGFREDARDVQSGKDYFDPTQGDNARSPDVAVALRMLDALAAGQHV